ncbi:MAG: SDR family oxidoreductase [Porticoccaceae bacterium]
MSKLQNKFDLSGKTAFVTGGGTGLGYMMARGLARNGAKVMIAGRRASVLEEAAARMSAEADGNPVLCCAMDLGDAASIDSAAQTAIETLGGVDILVGNAAQEDKAMVWHDQRALIDQLMAVNFTANVALVTAFSPHMRNQKWGRIIFSSSCSSILGVPDGMSIYSATKGALTAYAKCAAVELAHDGITVNSIILGTYHTEMLQTNILDKMDAHYGPGTGQKFINNFGANAALGRLGRPEEIEGQVQLLASEAGSYITGASVTVDGGLSIMMRPNPRS